MSTEHLSREAALRWQMGEASQQERAHVATCVQCQAATAPLNDALHLFGAAAREWGDARAATAQRAPQSHAARLGWSVIATVCALLLLMTGVGLRWHSQRTALQAAAHQQQLQQELAQDNALLEAVDQEISQVVPDALSPLSGSSSTQQ